MDKRQKIKTLLTAGLLGSFFMLSLFPVLAADVSDYVEVSRQATGYQYDLEPGDYYQDELKIQNIGDSEINLLIYPADSTPTSDGTLAFKQKRQNMFGVGSWIRFYPQDPPSTTGDVLIALYDRLDVLDEIEDICSIVQVPTGASYRSFREYLNQELLSLIPEPQYVYLESLTRWCDGSVDFQFRLPAGGEISFPFVISVPQDVGPGEHIGGIMFEAVQPETVENLVGSGQSGRLAVSVTQVVPGEIIKEVAITSFSAEPDETNENYLLSLELQNDGNISQNLEISFTANDKIFGSSELIERQAVSVLRGSSLAIDSEWPIPVFGKYGIQAQVVVDINGNNEVIQTPELAVNLVPWLEIFVSAGALVLILVIWPYLRARRQDKAALEDWKPYVVKKNDTMEFLAEKCRVSRKQILRVNNLSRSYKLDAGESLLLPLPVKSAAKKVRPANQSAKKKIDRRPGRSFDGATKTKHNKKTSTTVDKSKPVGRIRWRSVFISLIIIIVGVVVSLSIIRSVRDDNSGNVDSNENIEVSDGPQASGQASGATAQDKDKSDEDGNNNADEGTGQGTGEDIQGIEGAQEVAEPVTIKPQEINLWVLNGSGIPGLAGRLAGELKQAGFAVTYTGNAEHFGYDGITVYYQLSESRAEADFIRTKLEDLGYEGVKVENNINIKNTTIIIGQTD